MLLLKRDFIAEKVHSFKMKWVEKYRMSVDILKSSFFLFHSFSSHFVESHCWWVKLFFVKWSIIVKSLLNTKWMMMMEWTQSSMLKMFASNTNELFFFCGKIILLFISWFKTFCFLFCHFLVGFFYFSWNFSIFVIFNWSHNVSCNLCVLTTIKRKPSWM